VAGKDVRDIAKEECVAIQIQHLRGLLRHVHQRQGLVQSRVGAERSCPLVHFGDIFPIVPQEVNVNTPSVRLLKKCWRNIVVAHQLDANACVIFPQTSDALYPLTMAIGILVGRHRVVNKLQEASELLIQSGSPGSTVCRFSLSGGASCGQRETEGQKSFTS
jgi:hypothetical protein